MPILSEMTTVDPQRVLLYGEPKTGKSELAGNLAEKFNLIWFDLENGYSVLRKLPESWQARINLFRIPDTRSYPIAIETCLKMVKAAGPFTLCHDHGKVSCALCAKDPTKYSTLNLRELPRDTIVVFDSGTQLSNSCMAQIGRGKPEDYKFEFDDWAKLNGLLDTFYSHIQQAPFHCVVITHVTEAELEDGKIRIVPASGTRNFSRGVAKYFDHVAYCEVKNKKHMFGSATTYANNILVGSRTGATLETMDKPSLLPIFEGKIPKEGQNVNSQGERALSNIKVGPK